MLHGAMLTGAAIDPKRMNVANLRVDRMRILQYVPLLSLPGMPSIALPQSLLIGKA